MIVEGIFKDLDPDIVKLTSTVWWAATMPWAVQRQGSTRQLPAASGSLSASHTTRNGIVTWASEFCRRCKHGQDSLD